MATNATKANLRIVSGFTQVNGSSLIPNTNTQEIGNNVLFPQGTTTAQITKVHPGSYTVGPTATTTIDVNAGLLDPNNETVTFSVIRALHVQLVPSTVSTISNSITLDGALTQAVTPYKVPLVSDGTITVQSAVPFPTGVTVTNTSADKLYLVNPSTAGNAVANLIIYGN